MQLELKEEYIQIIELWKMKSISFDTNENIKNGWIHSLYLFCKENQKSDVDFCNIVLHVFKLYIWTTLPVYSV